MVPLSFVKPLQFLILIAALASLSGELKLWEMGGRGIWDDLFISKQKVNILDELDSADISFTKQEHILWDLGWM